MSRKRSNVKAAGALMIDQSEQQDVTGVKKFVDGIEIPAGKIDAGEDPLTCGLRELEEETGYVAEKLTLLTTIYQHYRFQDFKIIKIRRNYNTF